MWKGNIKKGGWMSTVSRLGKKEGVGKRKKRRLEKEVEKEVSRESNRRTNRRKNGKYM